MPSDTELLSRAVALDAKTWQLYTLRRAPGCSSSTASMAAEQIDAAQVQARAALSHIVSSEASDELRRLGIGVLRVDEKDPLAYPYFAIFDERSKQVEVNGRLIFRLARYLRQLDWQDETGALASWSGGSVSEVESTILSIALWHEVFHVIEAAGVLETRSGPLRGLRARAQERRLREARAEVAAVEVSRVCSGVEFSPVVLELAIALMVGDQATVLSALAEVS